MFQQQIIFSNILFFKVNILSNKQTVKNYCETKNILCETILLKTDYCKIFDFISLLISIKRFQHRTKPLKKHIQSLLQTQQATINTAFL